MLDLTLNAFFATLILLPGIVWALIWMKYSKTRPQTDKFYFSVYSLVASVACYSVVYLVSCFTIPIAEILQKKSVEKEAMWVVFLAVVVSVILGALSVYGSHKKWILDVMKRFKITVRDGEEDLWCSSLYDHLKDGGADAFVRIYDQKRDLIYAGNVHRISEEKSEKEIVLLNVKIYRNPTGELITEVAKIYLVFDHREFFIEFLSTKKESENDKRN